jgi:hypothetical protein
MPHNPGLQHKLSSCTLQLGLEDCPEVEGVSLCSVEYHGDNSQNKLPLNASEKLSDSILSRDWFRQIVITDPGLYKNTN